MSNVKGLTANSPFIDLLGDLPISTLLGYVHASWLAYAEQYGGSIPSFQKRKEPQLTQALAAHLRQRQDFGEQPFIGDFFGELADYVLDKSSGLPKCIARTDIEWRLHGVPALVVEFKVLDGKKARRDKYLHDGVMRFVIGRYASKAMVGAMFALLRKAAAKDQNLLLAEFETNGAILHCAGVKKSSELLPGIAAFDTTHQRNVPHVTPFHLTHLFVALPA
jgi:hypothetical protein